MKTTYEIWQRTPTERCLRNEINFAEWGPYSKVYKGTREVDPINPEATLEELFEVFNIRHPKDFRGHSLSVGDMVVFPQMECTFTCASFGWDADSHPDHKPATTDRYLG